MEAANGVDFAVAINQRLLPETKRVTVDLQALEFISLGATREFLRLARSLKAGQRRIDFLNGGEAVRRVLDQAGLDDFFHFDPPFSHAGRYTDDSP